MGTRSVEPGRPPGLLLTDHDTNSAYSEAYHTLYANICLDQAGIAPDHLSPSHCHTLLITTPAAYADHAAVAANLAIVAAQSGTPTLLVDADLRTAQLQQRFGLGKSAGLAELLAGEAITPEKVASHLQTTFVPGLRLLGAGMPTSQGTETGLAPALLFSPHLEEVVCSLGRLQEEAETRNSIVIFNSPPVLSGADASLIGALVEQTFLIIATGHTTRTQAKQAQEQLQRARVKLAGIIMFGK